jgi:phosphoesterase RecJ-like protein
MMTKFQEIIQAIDAVDNIVITAHRSPDGDSIGSSMALYHYLKWKNKNVQICHPDAYPNFLAWLPDVDQVLSFDENQEQIEHAISKADLIFALDYNHPSRLGDGMAPLLDGKREKTIMIDHHLNPADFAFISVSQTDVCSTSQLIYELIISDGEGLINETMGTPIYLGIMTDTGSFRFNSVTQRTHEVIGNLLAADVNHTAIHEAVFGQNSLNQLRLRSYAICNKLEIIEEGKVAILSLSEKELEEYHYEKGDTEGLVNIALSVSGVKMAIYLQEKDEKVKISFRSKEDQSVNLLAADHFEGGGHAYASGGINFDNLEATINKLKKVIHSYVL